MATFVFTDAGEFIQVDIGTEPVTRLVKKKYIKIDSVEPYIYFKYHDREVRDGQFNWKVDFNDATPAEASAADLKTALEAMIVPSAGYTDEQAQDAVGGIVSSYLEYDDATPGFDLAKKSKAAVDLFNYFNFT
jgi:hypothetical protein